MQSLLYYAAAVLLAAGILLGVKIALRARQDAREGVDLVNEAELLSEFQRARDSGEMDDAEFRRVRSLLIDGKRSAETGDEKISTSPGTLPPPPAPPTTIDPA